MFQPKGTVLLRNARFKHGPSGLAFALNPWGSILNTTGPALRDLAVREANRTRILPAEHGSDLEPIGPLQESLSPRTSTGLFPLYSEGRKCRELVRV